MAKAMVRRRGRLLPPGSPGSPAAAAHNHFSRYSSLAARELRSNASPASFARVQCASAVPGLCLHAHMRGHGGCVNTVAWSADGEQLISGSDDCCVCVWRAGDLRLAARQRTGHNENIFCARFVPESGCARAVTCAADGQVRHIYLPADGYGAGGATGSDAAAGANGNGGDGRADSTDDTHSELLARWQGMLMKFAFVPGSTECFVTTQSDGTVRCYDLREAPRRRMSSHPGTPRSRRYITLAGGSLFQSDEREGSDDGTDAFAAAMQHVANTSTTDVCFDPLRPELMAVASDADQVALYDLRRAGGVAGGAVALNGLSAARVKMFQPVGTHGCFTEGVSGIDFDSRGRLLMSYRGGHMYCVDTRAPDGGSHENFPDVGKDAGSDPETEEVYGPRDLRGHEMDVNVLEGVLTQAPEDDENAGGNVSHAYNVLSDRQRRRSRNTESVRGCVSQFVGHLNRRTFLKEARFFGDGQFAACGSDCGHLFVYEVASGRLLRRIPADTCIVNCVAPHPLGLPLLAVSGIDDDWRLFGPGAATPVPPPEGLTVGDIADAARASVAGRLELAATARPINQPGGARRADEVALGDPFVAGREAFLSMIEADDDDLRDALQTTSSDLSTLTDSSMSTDTDDEAELSDSSSGELGSARSDDSEETARAGDTQH